MSDTDVYWSSIKLLTFPRLTTVYDIARIIESLTVEPKSLVSGNYTSLPEKPTIRLPHLAVMCFRPIIRRKKRGFLARSDDIESWITRTVRIIETLLSLNEIKFARAISRQWINTYFYLLTMYALWNGLSPSQKEGIHRGEFEEKAFTILLNAMDDPLLLDIFERLGLRHEFEFSIGAYASALYSALSLASNESRNRLIRDLDKILTQREIFNKIMEMTEQKYVGSFESAKFIVDNMTYALSNYIRGAIISEHEDHINNITTIIRILRNIMSTYDARYKDLVWLITSQISESILNALNNNIDKAVSILEGTGRKILDEALGSMKFDERIVLRLMPEAQALLPAFVPLPINLSDVLSSVSINHTLNDIVNEILGVFLETKMLLASIMLLDEKKMLDFLLSAMQKPLASATLIFLLGSPSAWLLESALTAVGMMPKKGKKTLSRVVRVLTDYIDDILKTTKRLIDTKLGFITGKRICASHLLRETSFLVLRLTNEAVKAIEDIPNGKAFLSIVDSAVRYAEEIYGHPKIKKEEFVEELIT